LLDIFYNFTCQDLLPAIEGAHDEFFAPGSGPKSKKSRRCRKPKKHRKSALQRPTACWHSIPTMRKAPLVVVLEVLPPVYMHFDVRGGNMVTKPFGFGISFVTLAVVALPIFW
jgi:hypothetical protein